MPFQTDNAWPAGLLTLFKNDRAKHLPFENRYCGPYNTLLNYCFRTEFTFYIASQNPPPSLSTDSCDTINFIAFNSDDEPVLIFQVKGERWAQKVGLRCRADKEMRDQYESMFGIGGTPDIWGLSASSRHFHACLLW